MISEKIKQLFNNALNVFSAHFPIDVTRRQFEGDPDAFPESRMMELSRYMLDTLKCFPVQPDMQTAYDTCVEVLGEIDSALTAAPAADQTPTNNLQFSNDHLPG